MISHAFADISSSSRTERRGKRVFDCGSALVLGETPSLEIIYRYWQLPADVVEKEIGRARRLINVRFTSEAWQAGASNSARLQTRNEKEWKCAPDMLINREPPSHKV